MSVDLSVEYAHIYTNQQIAEEHHTSLQILSEVILASTRNSLSHSLVVMVDDYSFPDPSFDYEDLLRWLSSNGYPPDLLIRESQLIPACDEVVHLIQDKLLKQQISDYIRAKKYPCSLFIATWYLLRLGRIQSPIFPEKLQARQIVNILPQSFKPYEDKGLEIIGATIHSDCLKEISYKFIPGRQIE